MMMPNRKEIIAKAMEIFYSDMAKSGIQNFNTPEDAELLESGYIASAKSELLHSLKNRSAGWFEESENVETLAFQFDEKEAMQTTAFVSGSRGVGKSDVVMRIAEQLQNRGIIVIAFDPSTDWVKRSNIEKYITVAPYSDLPIPETSTIFDISRLTPNQAQECVEEFCKKLFEFQVGNSAKRFYLVLEEAQIYFPLNSLRSRKTQNSMRLLTVGRNFHVSMCAISQFPALIDKEMIKHSGQIWIGYASEPNSLKYWRGIIGKHAEKLRELQNGQFVYYCRNKITPIEIEPYESAIQKTQIATLDIAIHPISATSHSDAAEITRVLAFLGLFVVVMLIIGNMR
jgi:hypothetical protein